MNFFKSDRLLGGINSSASAINASGTIVGQGQTAEDSFEYSSHHAVRFSGNGANNVDLGTLGGSYSSATAINASGTIVGSSSIRGDYTHATLFSGNGAGNTDLGTLGGDDSYALAINDTGVIVGFSDTAFSLTHAFIYREGTMIDLNFEVSGGLGIVFTKAVGINNAG